MQYQNLLGKKLPENLLLIPVQYLIFGKRYYCTLFLEVEKEIGCGTFKRVEKAKVIDILGSLPLPEISSLRDSYIALYRPKEDDTVFVQDIISIIKLDELQLNNYVIKSYLLRIKGHSLFLPDSYNGSIEKYSELIDKNLIKTIKDSDDLMFCLKKSLSLIVPTDQIEGIIKEILAKNDVIDTPFMFSNFLPYDPETAFRSMEEEELLQGVYDMVSMVCYHAYEGIYFRDLRPDNLRVNDKKEVRLIDPSYISKDVKLKNRYSSFIEQTTPEYLPNEWTLMKKRDQESHILNYFGRFTEGVCVGMLERVFKRIFMPEYMGKKYDSLYLLSTSDRITQSHDLKLQEDVDLFKDTSFQFEEEHFVNYRENIAKIMSREGWSNNISLKLSKIMEILRKFSRPVVGLMRCSSYLKKDHKSIHINELPQYIVDFLDITPKQVKITSKYNIKNNSGSSNAPKEKKIIVDNDRSVTKRRSFADLNYQRIQLRPTKRSNAIDLEESLSKLNGDQEYKNIFLDIYEKRTALEKFLKENPNFFQKFKKNCIDVFRNGMPQKELHKFFQKADYLLSDDDLKKKWERTLRHRIPSNIHLLFEKYIPNEYQSYFESFPEMADTFHQVMCTTMIRVVKIRYLCSLDFNANIENYLPDLGEDIIDFVMQYDEENLFKEYKSLFTYFVSQI